MATYVNDLRLKEITTGDESGTWGTSTNTNLTLIGEAFGYATVAIADASTDTLTIPDGTETDSEPRRMYLKLTGGGQACTVTLAPNTVSKVWIIENVTSYTLTFTQGSGANVAILAGETKIIATDGAGSGAVVYDVLTDLNLAGTTKTAALTNAGALSNQGTVTVGVDDTGYDVKLFGATSGKYLLWDESADSLIVTGSTSQQGTLTVGVDDTGYDVKLFGATSGKYWLWDESADGVLQYSSLTVGVDDTGYDVKFFGATSGAYMLWDESADDLKLVGAAGFTVAGDIDIDGTANLDVVDIDGATQADGTITVGADDTGYDVKFFGATSGAYMLWDESADDLVLAGAAGLDIAGDIDVDGTANLDIVDIDGAVDMASTLAVAGVVTLSDSVAGDNAGLVVKQTNADANPATLWLQKDSASPADSDDLGKIEFYGDDDAGNATRFGLILCKSDDVSNGSEDGSMTFNTFVAGTSTNVMSISGGKVGIGTTAPDQKLHVMKASAGSIDSDSNSVLTIENDDTAALSILTPEANNGFIVFGNPTDGNADGKIGYLNDTRVMTFSTAGSEAMRIHSDGDLRIGTTGVVVGSTEVVSILSTGTYGMGIKIGGTPMGLWNTATSGTHVDFFYGSGGSAAGSITYSTDTTTYGTGSDYRLKENVNYDWDATTRLKQLKPARFNWIADDTNTLQDGFLAHEVQSVVPEAVVGTKDQVYTAEEAKSAPNTSEGDIKTQEMDSAKLVPLLVKTIQELEARITALEAE